MGSTASFDNSESRGIRQRGCRVGFRRGRQKGQSLELGKSQERTLQFKQRYYMLISLAVGKEVGLSRSHDKHMPAMIYLFD